MSTRVSFSSTGALTMEPSKRVKKLLPKNLSPPKGDPGATVSAFPGIVLSFSPYITALEASERRTENKEEKEKKMLQMITNILHKTIKKHVQRQQL